MKTQDDFYLDADDTIRCKKCHRTSYLCREAGCMTKENYSAKVTPQVAAPWSPHGASK